MGTQLNDDMVDAALGDLEQAELSAATVMALRLADLLTSTKAIVTPEFQTNLKKYFSDNQILELGSALAVASGWQRFIEAFGIRPDSFVGED